MTNPSPPPYNSLASEILFYKRLLPCTLHEHPNVHFTAFGKQKQFMIHRNEMKDDEVAKRILHELDLVHRTKVQLDEEYADLRESILPSADLPTSLPPRTSTIPQMTDEVWLGISSLYASTNLPSKNETLTYAYDVPINGGMIFLRRFSKTVVPLGYYLALPVGVMAILLCNIELAKKGILIRTKTIRNWELQMIDLVVYNFRPQHIYLQPDDVIASLYFQFM